MYCYKCGEKLEDEWKVCPYCRTRVESVVGNEEKCSSLESDEQMQREKKSNKKWNFTKKQLIVSVLLSVIIIMIPIAWKLFRNSQQPPNGLIDDKVRTLEEVGGYDAWVESEYSSRIRTDIVVVLPVTERKYNTYAVNIGTRLGDIIFIKQKDGSLATEWDWLTNATPYEKGGDIAIFKVTLTLDGRVLVDNKVYSRRHRELSR